MVFFSIIIPVYNRAPLVGRTLRSCLSQSFTDFEIVVVDDGSLDDSVDVVRSFGDPRIRLIVHERNLGRCPARNTAMGVARGQWFVFLDSDDELVEGALETIHRDALSVPSDVLGLRYMCVDDYGIVSPDAPHSRGMWTYEQYLERLDHSVGGRSETIPCARASTFPLIRYPEGHAEEGLYHLDLAKAGRVSTLPEVIRQYHDDATNQVTRFDYRRALSWAVDAAANADAVHEKHGPALARHAPKFYALRLRDGTVQHFLAGHRRRGLDYARELIRLDGLDLKIMLVVLIGLAGRIPLAMSQSLQGMIRRMSPARSHAALAERSQ